MRKEADIPDYNKTTLEQLRAREKEKSYERSQSSDQPEKDPMLDNLYQKLMITAPFLLDEDEADMCTILFVKHGVGIDLPEDIEKAWKIDWGEEAGKRLNNVSKEKALYDGESFWRNVRNKIPELISEEETEWLVKNDPRAYGGADFIFALAFRSPSTLADHLASYVHVWK